MITKTWLLLVLALVLAITVTGCGSAPTPTRPAPTQPPAPPAVVTVIVTPTALPPTATVQPPTITPIATLVPITTVVPVATIAAVKPTTAPVTRAATATKRPATPVTPVVVAPTRTPAPVKYAAPAPVRPIYDEARGQKDERHYPADVLKFEWQSVGPLQGNECYQIRVDFNPGQGDTFLQCDPTTTGTQTPLGALASFTLNKPNQAGPNYSALLPTTAGETNVNWSVQVVKDDGKGTGGQTPDGVRHATTPLSPKSSTVLFLLKGG